MDAALNYAKNMAKYMKDLIGYLEKRSALGESGPRVWPDPRAHTSLRHLFPCPLPSPHPTPLLPLSYSTSLPHLPPALTSLPFLPVEMDFAKGLQKIVHHIRQSVMQEVGHGAPGRTPSEEGRREGLPISAVWLREWGGVPGGLSAVLSPVYWPCPHSPTCPSCPSTRWH